MLVKIVWTATWIHQYQDINSRMTVSAKLAPSLRFKATSIIIELVIKVRQSVLEFVNNVVRLK